LQKLITMTPKEKAEELIEKFSSEYPIICKMNTRNMYISEAKHCALIAVNEILRVAYYANDDIYNLYLDVKKEIEKL